MIGFMAPDSSLFSVDIKVAAAEYLESQEAQDIIEEAVAIKTRQLLVIN